MNTRSLEKQFARMGARVNVHASGRFTVDVLRDRQGPRFDIGIDDSVAEVHALDVRPAQRHLLLVVKRGETNKFLCGHDERDWFAAAIPSAGGVTNVLQAMDALKPPALRRLLVARHVKHSRWNRRRTSAFVRQGEWFFVPEPKAQVDPLLVLHNEPLTRGRGKAHWVEFLCRSGGDIVYVSNEHPGGLSFSDRQKLFSRQPHKQRLKWVLMRRNPAVYARGRVRHPDHKTICLDGWHQVLMNTENQASSMRHLTFLD
jgi:hypothetical protein